MSADEAYELTTDRDRLDAVAIHDFLTTSYWAAGIALEAVRATMRGSLCFGYLQDGRTVAFARVVTDEATFAYLADVFVLPEHRGRGLGKALVAAILDDDRLVGLRRWVLRTEDAHDLYRRFGFAEIAAAETWMERRCDG